MNEKSFALKKWGIIGICSAIYFVSYFSRKDFAAVMAGMLAEGAIDKEVAGLVGTMLFIFYGIGQLISGYLGDRINPKALIMTGLGATAICNFCLPFCENALIMIPVWAVNGLAQAMLWPPIVRILSDNLDHESFVKANLVVTAAAHIATILLYLYVPLCLEYFSWETVFYTASAMALLSIVALAVAMFFIMPSRPKSESKFTENVTRGEAIEEKESIFALFIKSGVLPVFVSIICCGFLRDGIESWLPTLYSEAFSRDAGESILVSVILPIFAIASIVAVTAIHKRKLFNHELRGSGILFIIAAILCIPLWLLIEVKSFSARVICLVLASLVCAAMHGANFLLISCLPGRFSRYGRASTASGLCNACVYIGAAISMYGIAVVSENFGWTVTIICWLAVCALGAAFCLPSLKRYEMLREEG